MRGLRDGNHNMGDLTGLRLGGRFGCRAKNEQRLVPSRAGTGVAVRPIEGVANRQGSHGCGFLFPLTVMVPVSGPRA
jgi:hypothetical protein